MKTPLRYQVSEFDCGTVSLQNAVSYLFDREDLPLELVKAIHLYAVDCYGDSGEKSDDWLSSMAISKLCDWITSCTKKKDFKLYCNYLSGLEVGYDEIENCIRSGGVAFIKCYCHKDMRFVIITNINKLNTYIFDPYYVDDKYYDNDNDIKNVIGKPLEYNRIVRSTRVFSEMKKDFALGDTLIRECVLMNRK